MGQMQTHTANAGQPSLHCPPMLLLLVFFSICTPLQKLFKPFWGPGVLVQLKIRSYEIPVPGARKLAKPHTGQEVNEPNMEGQWMVRCSWCWRSLLRPPWENLHSLPPAEDWHPDIHTCTRGPTPHCIWSINKAYFSKRKMHTYGCCDMFLYPSWLPVSTHTHIPIDTGVPCPKTLDGQGHSFCGFRCQNLIAMPVFRMSRRHLHS